MNLINKIKQSILIFNESVKVKVSKKNLVVDEIINDGDDEMRWDERNLYIYFFSKINPKIYMAY